MPDSISLLDPKILHTLAGAAPSQLTDLYLLALAVSHSAKFVTLGARVPADFVRGGANALIVIP